MTSLWREKMSSFKVLFFALMFVLASCGGGGGEGDVSQVPGNGGGGSIPGGGGSSTTCNDMNAINLYQPLPCTCIHPMTPTADGKACENLVTSFTGWKGLDQNSLDIDDTDISQAAPAGGPDLLDNHILVPNKFLIGEVSQNVFGAAIKDPSCSPHDSALYVGILFNSSDPNKPSATYLGVSGFNLNIREVGVVISPTIVNPAGLTPYQNLTDGVCNNGEITYSNGDKLIHNGDFLLYKTGTSTYVGVRDTSGLGSVYYVGDFRGLASAPSSNRDFGLVITPTPTHMKVFPSSAGLENTVRSNIASMPGLTESMLFSQKAGTFGVLAEVAYVSISFDNGNYLLSSLPSSSVLRSSSHLYGFGYSNFFFGTRQ